MLFMRKQCEACQRGLVCFYTIFINIFSILTTIRRGEVIGSRRYRNGKRLRPGGHETSGRYPGRVRVEYDVAISSAHLPRETARYAETAAERGLDVIIAGAGGAATWRGNRG